MVEEIATALREAGDTLYTDAVREAFDLAEEFYTRCGQDDRAQLLGARRGSG